MSIYLHSISDPEELLQRREFYASASDQAEGIHRVFELAQNQARPSLDLAKKVAAHCIGTPPKNDRRRDLVSYVKRNILSLVPRNTRYDDIFWCCLLHILDAEDVPECYIGGPLHELIYQVYDDFDPADVLE